MSDDLSPSAPASPTADSPAPHSPAAQSPAEPAPEPGWQALALSELSQRRNALLEEIRQLESRRGQIEKEISASFTGQADAVARRLKGF